MSSLFLYLAVVGLGGEAARVLNAEFDFGKMYGNGRSRGIVRLTEKLTTCWEKWKRAKCREAKEWKLNDIAR